MKPLFSGSPTLNKIFALVQIGLGAGGLATLAKYFESRSNYAEYSSVVVGITGIQTMGTVLDVSAAGAAIVLLGGVISFAAAFRTSTSSTARSFYMVGLLLAIVGGVLELAGGITVITHPFNKALGPETYVNNEAIAGQELTGDQSKMSLFGQAAWTKCCLPNNWISLGPYGSCETACPSAASGQIIDTRIDQFAQYLDVSLLCTCVRPAVNATYQQYLNAFGSDQCKALTRVKVDYPGTTNIPTTCEQKICLSVDFIKNRLYGGTTILRAPLIGYQLDAATSGGTAEDGEGFGCGLGYQKGVMWFQVLYHVQVVTNPANSALGLGVAAAVVSVVIIVLGLFLRREDADMGDANWENTLAANWNDPETTKPVPVATLEPTTAKVDEAALLATPAVSAYQMNANDFTDQLIKFYSKYDPSKTQKEIENIANWGKQYGLAALNKKLRDKYSADLSTSPDADPPI